MRLSNVMPIATLLTAMTACDAGRTKQQAETGASEIQSGASAHPDACEVLTVADLQPYVSEPLVARPGTKGPNETKCEYWGKDFVAGFSVVWKDGKSEFEMYNSGIDIAAKMMAEPGVNVDSIVRPGPVAGLGDAAMFSDIMPSFVLVGDRLLQFQLMLVPSSRSAFVPLVSKAISRLE